jgi:hypothetical protein
MSIPLTGCNGCAIACSSSLGRENGTGMPRRIERVPPAAGTGRGRQAVVAWIRQNWAGGRAPGEEDMKCKEADMRSPPVRVSQAPFRDSGSAAAGQVHSMIKRTGTDLLLTHIGSGHCASRAEYCLIGTIRPISKPDAIGGYWTSRTRLPRKAGARMTQGVGYASGRVTH